MFVWLKLIEKKNIPTMSELVEAMWKKDINISRTGNERTLKNDGYLTLSWDKWLDDERWKENSKCKEYIYFDVEKRSGSHYLSIEIDDAACFLDIRAFHQATIYIAKKTNALISKNEQEWILLNHYLPLVSEYTSDTFEEANERSLNET